MESNASFSKNPLHKPKKPTHCHKINIFLYFDNPHSNTYFCLITLETYYL